MDVTLPDHERMASPKFRRVCEPFRAKGLLWDHAAELVAFLSLFEDMKAPAYIFGWKGRSIKLAERIVAQLRDDPKVVAMVEQNRVTLEKGDGLKCLSAMQAGGWHRGRVPRMVYYDMQDMRAQGMSHGQVAAACGVTRDQVRNITTGIRATRVRPLRRLPLLASVAR